MCNGVGNWDIVITRILSHHFNKILRMTVASRGIGFFSEEEISEDRQGIGI